MSRDNSPSTFIHYFPSSGEHDQQAVQAIIQTSTGTAGQWEEIGRSRKQKRGLAQKDEISPPSRPVKQELVDFQTSSTKRTELSHSKSSEDGDQSLAIGGSRQFFNQVQELNANLLERFQLSENRNESPSDSSNQASADEASIYFRVRDYFNVETVPDPLLPWLSRSEFPLSCEILDTEDDTSYGRSGGDGSINLGENRVQGAWDSKSDYLGTHYHLLREDAIRPLREAVCQVRARPYRKEADCVGKSIGIYENVNINAITLAPQGIGIRVTFSLGRAGKRIRWEQSNRLISGSLVALTPALDMFQKKCIVAVVAARPLAGLEQNPPEIDLFFARTDEIEIDPDVDWVMVEDRSGFYEAERHTLLALQKLMTEPFPMAEHLVEAQPHVNPPVYVKHAPLRNLSSIFSAPAGKTFEAVDILSEWPRAPPTQLDESQLKSLQRILTKRLAIIQGPPGTGKTHVSVMALRAMLANMVVGDPPIVIACQTNHALDQLLRHVAEFEPNFIRLGGRSKDQDVIKRRTLYEVRQATLGSQAGGGLKKSANVRLRKLREAMAPLLEPLSPEQGPLDQNMLLRLNLLTHGQVESLEKGASEWVQYGSSTDSISPFIMWMGDHLIPAGKKHRPDEFGYEFEEIDLEFEQLKELEAETFAKDDEDFESLKGLVVPLAEKYTGKTIRGITNKKIRSLLEEQDMWQIPRKYRGSVYAYLQRQVKEIILARFRQEAHTYADLVKQRKIGAWEQDALLLKQQKVIGLTTTGFSKYRALVSSMRPKIVLIEEAAESLEAPITATCVPSMEHLILVGDHQQLRPHCHVKDHEDYPFHLNVSMFERLLNNNLEYDILRRQRRMIPEIRRILDPIYGDIIEDHPSVKDPLVRPPVPGMGGVNSFFFTHEWTEERDELMSSRNMKEADMIVGFFEYLVYNGAKPEEITVLTFYNGQRKAILRGLRKCPNLAGSILKVVTVDSYQGEENGIVLLSLVRSNDNNSIGFLKVDNRVCVALSRARRGFYLFGNGELLCYESKTWSEVIYIMSGENEIIPISEPKLRVGYHLPLLCSQHGRKTWIDEPDQFVMLNGGCEESCKGILPCGHQCRLKCHPFGHEAVNCTQKCSRQLRCGHKCDAECCEACRCSKCANAKGKGTMTSLTSAAHLRAQSQTRSTTSSASAPEVAAWHSFAQGEERSHQVREDEAIRKVSALEKQQRLIDAGSGDLDERRIDSLSENNMPLAQDSSARASPDLIPLADVANQQSGAPTRKVFKQTYKVEKKPPPPINLLD